MVEVKAYLLTKLCHNSGGNNLNSSNKNVDIIRPIIFSLVYTIYFYVATKLIVENNMHISIHNITVGNIYRKLMEDFVVMLLIPCILMIIYRGRLIELKLHFTHTYLQYALIVIMALLFILHNDFTIQGFYKPFFYLVIVAFGEELVFRGYVYNKLSKYNRLLAIIVSGFFFGILHAILPGIVAGDSLERIIFSMINEIGGGIIMGYYFIYLLEKSKSLYIPIFVHAILNYSRGGIGIITMIGAGVYLYIADKNGTRQPLHL